MSNKKGKLIVIEGLDGCGKATQAELLSKRLNGMEISNRVVSFPDYDSDSSKLIKMYLRGDFGTQPGDVNAYAASGFFALDRFASFRTDWREDYLSGRIIIANRYTTSNAPHQMSKLPREQWDEFLGWLLDYEYRLLELPEPDLVIQLLMPNEVSERLLIQRYGGEEAKKDIHERAGEYQKQCAVCAAYAAQKYGWTVIDCTEGGELRTKSDIADELFTYIEGSDILYD